MTQESPRLARKSALAKTHVPRKECPHPPRAALNPQIEHRRPAPRKIPRRRSPGGCPRPSSPRMLRAWLPAPMAWRAAPPDCSSSSHSRRTQLRNFSPVKNTTHWPSTQAPSDPSLLPLNPSDQQVDPERVRSCLRAWSNRRPAGQTVPSSLPRQGRGGTAAVNGSHPNINFRKL